MNREDKIVKEIFETLIKYTNLTPDAIDDLYYLQGYIEEKDKEIERLKGRLKEINCLIHKALNDREINGVGNLNLNMILELTGSDKE